MKSKIGQGWGFDLLIAVTIFIIGISVFYFYAINYPTEGTDTLETLNYEGEVIADLLLSEGFPRDWNESIVIQIGILSGEKVNFTKLGRLYNMTINETQAGKPFDIVGYDRTRGLFNTRFQYFINFSKEMDGVVDEGIVTHIGRNYRGESINPKNLFKVTRFTIYDNKPTSMNIFIWEE